MEKEGEEEREDKKRKEPRKGKKDKEYHDGIIEGVER